MIVNGEVLGNLECSSVLELLNYLNLSPEKVVVEVNGDIISKENYHEPLLNEKAIIEIVSFVGGG